MSQPAEKKKTLTAREKKRARASKNQKQGEREKKIDSVTNTMYLTLKEKLEDERKHAKSPDKMRSLDSSYVRDEGEELEDQEEDESTDVSGNSDSGESQQATDDHQKLLFSGSGVFVKWWNNIIIILAMYNSILIPLQLFYADMGHSKIDPDTGQVVAFIDACVDLLFLVDIIIRFRTTFLDPKQSIEIRDPHIIAKKYLKGSFFIDFISSVPFNSLISTSSTVLAFFLDFLGMLKLLRLGRLYTTVQRSNMEQEIKVYFKVAMISIYLLVIIHLLSCIWFQVVSQHERWVQNMDFMYVNMDEAFQGFYEGDESFLHKYMLLLYTGFYIFGVGEIVPREGTLEFFSAFLLCSLCTIFNALIIGYMTTYMEDLNSKSAELADKLNLTNTAMLNLKLSRGLKKEITQYIYQTHTTKQLQTELTNFMTQISPVYKRRVTKESFRNLVDRNSVLKEVKDIQVAMKKR